MLKEKFTVKNLVGDRNSKHETIADYIVYNEMQLSKIQEG